MKIENKHKAAIVTGGARGIGEAIVRNLATGGFDVHVSFNKSGEQFTKLQSELAGQNVSLTSTIGDLTIPKICERVVDDCIAEHGRLDALILNAGLFVMGDIETVSTDDWQNLVNTNLSSAISLLKYSLSHLRKTKGAVVFLGTGSISQPVPATEYTAYEVSKAGLYVLMRSLSVSEGVHGVRVNMVSPGVIDTGSMSKPVARKLSREVPLRRLGKPEEVAEIVGFLLSEQASYVNGANIDVTGGWIRKK